MAHAEEPVRMEPAVAVLELASIAVGIEAGDAMVKRAPVDVVRTGTIHPGKYVVLVAGSVADVEEAYAAGMAVGAGCLVDAVLLPNVHPAVVEGLRGRRRAGAGEALGVVETATVAAINAGMRSAIRAIRGSVLSPLTHRRWSCWTTTAVFQSAKASHQWMADRSAPVRAA